MADQKISQLTAGNPAQSADAIPIARLVSGTETNFSITAGGISALAGPWLNVLTFGCVGDGTTNNDACFTALQAAIPTSGANVYFPQNSNGTQAVYQHNTTISVTNPQRWFCAGINGSGNAPTRTGVIIQSNGAIVNVTVGLPTSLTQQGFETDNCTFNDGSGTGLGGLLVQNTDRNLFYRQAITNYTTSGSYGARFDGSGCSGCDASYSEWIQPFFRENDTCLIYKQASVKMMGGEFAHCLTTYATGTATFSGNFWMWSTNLEIDSGTTGVVCNSTSPCNVNAHFEGSTSPAGTCVELTSNRNIIDGSFTKCNVGVLFDTGTADNYVNISSMVSVPTPYSGDTSRSIILQSNVGAFFNGTPITTPAVITNTYTVATLPSAATLGLGAMVVVTDALTAGIGGCVGGGSTIMMAISSGSVWSCH